MKQDFRGLVLQAQGVQHLGERVITTVAEAVIFPNDFTLAVKLATPGPLTIPLPPPNDLPAEPGSARLRIRDAANNAGTHNITIAATGTTINGATTYVISTNGGNLDFEWTGSAASGWVSYAQPPGTGTISDITGAAPIVVTGATVKNVAIDPATPMAAGSLSATDKAKLDGIAAGATETPLSNAIPQNTGTATAGISTSASRADHVHDLPAVGPGAATYTNPSSITVDAKGRVTAANTGTAPPALPLSVANGGTGAASLTTNGVVLGNGTSPVSVTGPGTAGQVFTSAGPATPGSYQDPVTSTTGSATATDTTITGNETYMDIGLEVTLPSAGTYLVQAEVFGTGSVGGSAPAYMSAIFRNHTDAADIASSERCVVVCGTVDILYGGMAVLSEIITVNASKVIKTRVMRADGGGTFTNSNIIGNSSGFNVSRMRYIRLNYH